MTRILVCGALGRMGREIIKAALADSECVVTGGVERAGHPALGGGLREILGEPLLPAEAKLVPPDEVARVAFDVAIDFSEPAATVARVAQLSEMGRVAVIGTTGLNPSEIERVRTAAKSIPVVLAPNMSLGANLLFWLAKKAASLLPADYDIEITEAHHRHKKDAPSGTAIRLAESICEAKRWRYAEAVSHGRSGVSGERPKNQIGMHAIRGGEIIGDHTALFAGPGESVELRHQAYSRQAFAKGSVIAAKFAHRQKPGLYGMEDVLGLPQ